MDAVYVPFWILLDYVKTPTEPFVKCRVVREYETTHLRADNLTPVNVQCYDLDLGNGEIAKSIPISYTINQAELPHWADRLARWIVSYAEKETEHAVDGRNTQV